MVGEHWCGGGEEVRKNELRNTTHHLDRVEVHKFLISWKENVLWYLQICTYNWPIYASSTFM